MKEAKSLLLGMDGRLQKPWPFFLSSGVYSPHHLPPSPQLPLHALAIAHPSCNDYIRHQGEKVEGGKEADDVELNVIGCRLTY